ncbi:MAG: 30S ribosomal protein S13, partial [Candidatus Pacebacteria bacterium]|nr:30S ribosomal protein S13 [Candidatus Paceibacterota bacterium]
MPRISGIDIPDHKKVLFALQSIYGIGPKRAQQIIDQTGVDPDKRAKELVGPEINKIQKALEQFAVEGELRRVIND